MALALVRPDLLYAWKGCSLLIVGTTGACGGDTPLSGYYYREARFIRTLALEINGRPPWLCEAAASAPDLLEFTFAHPEISQPGGGGTGQSDDQEKTDDHGLPERALEVRLSHRAGLAGLQTTIAVTNRAMRTVSFELAVSLDADFADMQEALSGRREQEAPVRAVLEASTVMFSYDHPRLPFQTEVETGGTCRWDGDRLSRAVELSPAQSLEWTLRIMPHTRAGELSPDDVAEREVLLERWRRGFTTFEIPRNREAEAILRANVRDFASFPLLTGSRDEWLAMQAGMPLYPALFGRDAITAGWQAACVDRAESLDAALRRVGRLQSDRLDDWRDEEPGRIPYQVRSGPLALLNVNPYAAYFADFASPLMFVIALANLYAWTGEPDRVRRHWDTARRILDWARERGDADGDGYLEYRTRSEKGTKNQGWKDSGDAVIYDDGRPVPAPIATCELQGYWYIAQELMALLSVALEAPGDAAAYRAAAADLKTRFNRDWWMPSEQFYALALDPAKEQVRAVTSNVGHCLACGIIDAARLPAVVGRMFAPDLFSGWGVRTLSTRHRRYDPLSYHRGSVWAVEQATIVFGLRRFGFEPRALDLAQAQFELARLYPEYRIPECVGGYARGDRATPAAYPRANTPQLWNATAFPLIVQSLLGLLPLAPARTLLLDPVLPTWLPEIVLRDLRVGGARVTLRFWRDDGEGTSKWEVLHRQGTLHVVRQPPPESVHAGLGDRMRAALESLVS
ncbi:MAG TPA: glycogen debranching N-terminal domain-containing protein [Vicinamibacterales bacterium]|nr:glycogen debranching N-terminal domain-containing protein [Vicinamibacterales bacterium]